MKYTEPEKAYLIARSSCNDDWERWFDELTVESGDYDLACGYSRGSFVTAWLTWQAIERSKQDGTANA